MIATSLLYLQSKTELAGMNKCGSVTVPVDVFFATPPQKFGKISSNIMQSCFVAHWKRALRIPTNRFRKSLK
jgi:hypothetical protein